MFSKEELVMISDAMNNFYYSEWELDGEEDKLRLATIKQKISHLLEVKVEGEVSKYVQ